MTASNWLTSTALGVLALAAAPAAFAQSTSATPAADTPQDVVVIAKKFGSGLTRATTVLDKSDIAARPMGADITQSLNKVPGVTVSTGDARGGSFSFEMSMRGLTDQQIGLTLDGIPTGDARFNGGSPPQRFIDSSNISRITVSQSAGDIGAPSRFALGGFIDFVSDNPAKAFGVTLEGGLGSYDFSREYVRVDSGELWKGFTSYLSYTNSYNKIWATPDVAHDYKAHWEFKGVQTFDNGSTISARISTNHQFDNDFNIVTLPQYLSNKRSDQASDVLTGKPAIDQFYGGDYGGLRNDGMAYINSDFVIGDKWHLKINPYYQTLRGYSLSYQTSQKVMTGGDPFAVTGYNSTGGAIRPAVTTTSSPNTVGGPADMRVTPRNRDRFGSTAELVADDLFAGQTIRIGAWWERSASNENRDFYPIINSAQSIDWNTSKLDYVQYARSVVLKSEMLYAQDEVRAFNDRLKVDVGATWYNLTYSAKSPLEYNAVLNFSQHSAVQPKLGATWKLTDHAELFGGYAENFAGIPENTFLGSTAVVDPKTIKPSTTSNYDLGLRYVRSRLALSVQAFYVDLDNSVGIVTRDSTVGVDPNEIIRGNVATKAANTEGQKDTGLDLTAYYDFGAVDLYGAYTYQYARHDNPPVGSTARAALEAVGIIGGARVRDIPANSVYGDIGWKVTPDAKVSLNIHYVADRVGGHIIAAAGGTELGVEKIPDYTLVGLNAYYDLNRTLGHNLRLQFNVDNLFNTPYLASVSEATNTSVELGATVANPNGRTISRYFVGAPRTTTLSLRAKF